MPSEARNAGQHRRLSHDAAFAVAGDEPLMQIGRDDAELGSQLEDIPIAAAEDADRRRSVGRRQRAIFVREQPQQERFPGAVGADDGGVLAGADGQRQAIEDAATGLDDRRVDQLEDRRGIHASLKFKGQS